MKSAVIKPRFRVSIDEVRGYCPLEIEGFVRPASTLTIGGPPSRPFYFGARFDYAIFVVGDVFGSALESPVFQVWTLLALRRDFDREIATEFIDRAAHLYWWWTGLAKNEQSAVSDLEDLDECAFNAALSAQSRTAAHKKQLRAMFDIPRVTQ